MNTVTDGCCIIDALCGIDTASPQIGQFTDNFDTIKFLLGDNFDSYTFMIITDIGGHVEIVTTDGEALTKETDTESKNTTLIWRPSTEVTASSGVVVYQIVAYKSEGNTVESTWYSKEGRLTVSQSISTTTHSAEVIGSEPNLLTKLILEIAENKSSVESLAETKVDKAAGKDLSDENYSLEEKEKLSGIESGAEVNVQSDWEESDETKDSFIKNKPKIDQSYLPDSANAQSGKAVAEALAQLVGGSPEALDTLNELAKALGDDPNFAATTAEEIGKKADSDYVESTYATKSELKSDIGNIETALDGIIAIQNNLLGVSE